MKAVDFPQRNLMLAEDQPEYETLPVHVERKEFDRQVVTEDPSNPIQYEKYIIPWSMTACFELTDEEVEEIVRTRRIYHRQLIMGNAYQPILMSTQNPFEEKEVANG